MSQAKKAAISLANDVIKAGLWPCCLNCDHWLEVTTVDCSANTKKVHHECGRYRMIPPPETIVVGCAQHIKTIPF